MNAEIHVTATVSGPDELDALTRAIGSLIGVTAVVPKMTVGTNADDLEARARDWTFVDREDESWNADDYFPPDPHCSGCAGTGWLHSGKRCVCVQHEAGECEPQSCSPECKRRRNHSDE